MEYKAFCEPVQYPMSENMTSHYESLGHFTGDLDVDGMVTPLNGYAFFDHSWGPRSYGNTLSGRFLTPIFGEHLFASLTWVKTTKAHQFVGWLSEGGVIRRLRGGTSKFTTGDDGVTPISGDACVWSPEGKGYVFPFTATATEPAVHDGDFFASNGSAIFEFGGQRGCGAISLSSIRALPFEDRQLLGMDENP